MKLPMFSARISYQLHCNYINISYIRCYHSISTHFLMGIMTNALRYNPKTVFYKPILFLNIEYIWIERNKQNSRAATNDYFHYRSICLFLFSLLVVWSIKCQNMVKHVDQMFPKAQGDVLKCPVLSTTKRYSIYYYRRLKKNQHRTYLHFRGWYHIINLLCYPLIINNNCWPLR